MSQSLKLLASCREARREAAIVKLATAKSTFDRAYAACEQACFDLEQSRQWRADVLARCALGEGQALRESLFPACEALLHRRQQQFAQKQSELRLAHEHLTAQRQHLTARERDTLRLQEWQQLQRSQRQRERAAQENLQDDEYTPRHRVRTSAA